jgi:hypothetical protein
VTTSLAIPVITNDMSTMEAAYAYAKAGLYIGPSERGSKHPGSVIGDKKTRKGWQRHTSRDIQVITSWFSGTDHGLFIHAGRSDLWIADVDDPANIHPKLQQAIAECEPPYLGCLLLLWRRADRRRLLSWRRTGVRSWCGAGTRPRRPSFGRRRSVRRAGLAECGWCARLGRRSLGRLWQPLLRPMRQAAVRPRSRAGPVQGLSAATDSSRLLRVRMVRR